MSRRAAMRIASGSVQALALLLCLHIAAAQTPEEKPQPVVLDSVVAVVNRHAILASDIDDEIRLAVLDPSQSRQSKPTRQSALEQIISRTLIEQQIRREDEHAVTPSKDEVNVRLNEIRRELPVCRHRDCVSEEGWNRFLTARGLTSERVTAYMRYRLEILSFIELRFRQGIRITPEEVKEYYTRTLLPQYAEGESAPPLDQVSSRIEEILLEQRVNMLFDDWLANLRKQGDIEVLDPALETSVAEKGAGQ